MMEIDENEVTSDSAQQPVPARREKAGELLKREREKRQLSIDAVAQRLRLNAKYIESLEESHYDRLPGDTYIRVYLRSLAQFLSLDSEEILNRFFEERGLTEEEARKKDRSAKLTLTQVVERKASSPRVPLIIFLIIVVAIFAFVARKHGWISHGGKAGISATDTTGRAAAESTQAGTRMPAESSQVMGPAKPPQGAAQGPQLPPGTQTAPQAGGIAPGNSSVTVTQQVPAGNLLRLRITVVGDSCRVRVYSDGSAYQKVLTRGTTMPFTAQDSFNIYLGESGAVALTFNGKPVDIPNKTGASALKIDHTGITWWTIEKWKATFH